MCCLRALLSDKAKYFLCARKSIFNFEIQLALGKHVEAKDQPRRKN